MNKALIIAYNDLNNSGVPNVVYQTIKALCHDYSFDVLVFGDDDYYYKKLQKEGIDIKLIKYRDNKPKFKLFRPFWWRYVGPHNHYKFMKQLLSSNRYVVIHSFKERDSWPFFKAAKEEGVSKRIFHCNVNLKAHQTWRNMLLAKRNTRLSIKYATNLIGVSELSCKIAFNNNKYTVLYNSYDEHKYNMNVKNVLSEDELVIAHVASYNYNKNQLFSLAILKELKKLHSNTRINLIGATDIDPYYQSLIDFVKDNNLEDSVSFIERIDDVNKIYEYTTFTILPSFSEGLGITVIEAQACGITVFVSTNVTTEVDCGGVSFLDLNKGAAYWADCIYKEFKEHKNIRTKYNVDKFSFDKFQRSLLDIYNSK